MTGREELAKGDKQGFVEREELGKIGKELLESMRKLASDCEGIIEWNEELVSKNKELSWRLETLQSHGRNLSERVWEALATELATLLRDFEYRVLTAVRQAVEKSLRSVDH